MNRQERNALNALCMECGGTLQALQGWQAADEMRERLSALLSGAGGEGLSAQEVLRLRRWAARWGALNYQLRAFYSSALQRGRFSGAVGAAVAVIVGDMPRFRLSPSARGVIAQMWRNENGGESCPYSLFPNLDHAWSTP